MIFVKVIIILCDWDKHKINFGLTRHKILISCWDMIFIFFKLLFEFDGLRNFKTIGKYFRCYCNILFYKLFMVGISLFKFGVDWNGRNLSWFFVFVWNILFEGTNIFYLFLFSLREYWIINILVNTILFDSPLTQVELVPISTNIQLLLLNLKVYFFFNIQLLIIN